jgi:RHS repeat-associated protein
VANLRDKSLLRGRKLGNSDSGKSTPTATDQLGSPRVLTDKLGNIVSRRDFLPFGEEIYANSTANRTEANKYSTSGQDAVRQRFTGYQKDIETGLDFAEARYYNNQHGRFTAVDPLLASGKSANPQTFNRYVYTMNRPLILIDSTGLQSGKTAPPERVNTPMYVDPTGNLFSTTQDKGYTPFDGTAYATRGGKNYQVTGSGYVEIGIPAQQPTNSDAGSCSCITSESISIMNAAKAMILAAGVAATAYNEYQQAMRDPAIQFAMNASIIGAPLTVEANLAREASLADDALVIRNGEMVAGSFTNGSGVVADEAGVLSGVSVKSANGLRVDELATGPLITKNGQIGVSTAGAIRNAGGKIIPDNPVNPVNPFHCETCGLTEEQFLEIFKQQPNPIKRP